MKISLKWLSDYVNVSEYFAKPEELANLLTNKGLEVESVENKSKDFDNVVIGHILEKAQHPDADRLSVCQVTTGNGVVHQIVCGAKNHKTGDRVVASLPGAVLPGNFEIKRSKIRGVESAGMLCSEVELGIAKESDGIMILPTDAEIGKPFAEYYGLNDVIFEIKVTANRADCLSHYGLAREVACLLGRDCALPIGTIETGSGSTKEFAKLTVLDNEDCPRYGARVIRDVKVGPSPDWLRRRLEAVGMNSINNVVDTTNYVMMELGQPMHAFDLKFLKGAQVIVAKSTPGEKFTSLDGTEFTLDGTELMIKDSEKSVGMAGVVGGKNSGVQDDTQDLFIECAYFTPGTVRKSSRKHGIQTDSAYRFSRGVDPEGTMLALNRCSELILKVAGGKIAGDHYDVYPNPIAKKAISVSLEQIENRLGYAPDKEEFEMWMKRLGCRVESVGGNGYIVAPPTYRPDIEIKEDLMEEYARLKGYDAIPEKLPKESIEPSPHAPAYSLSRLLSRKFVAEGFQQSSNLGFVSEKLETQVLGERAKYKAVGIDMAAVSVKIKNPLSEDLGVMRSSLVPGLIQNCDHNQRYGIESGRLFEIGYTFDKAEEGGYHEDWRLGIVAWGSPVDLWNKNQAPLVLDVKSSFENVLKGLQARNFTWTPSEQVPDLLHPGQSAYLFYEGKVVGYLGTLHPKLESDLKLKGPVVVGEFDLSLLLQGQPRVTKTKSISKFPLVERDMAFLMPKVLPAQEVATAIKKAGGQQLQSVRVFDVFEGASLPPDQRSVAFRVVYQDANATLTDEVILKLQEKVVNEVTKKLSITQR